MTGFAGGTDLPLAAALTIPGGGEPAGNLAIVPVGDQGTVSFFSNVDTHLIVDVVGYFGDETAAPGDDGLFVPLAPTRVVDTRELDVAIGAGSTVLVDLDGPTDTIEEIDAGMTVVANVAGINAHDRGFVTASPANTPRPETSTLNLSSAGDVRSNAAFIPVGARDGVPTIGGVDVFTFAGNDLTIDVAGYFTG